VEILKNFTLSEKLLAGCEVCGSSYISPALDLGMHPLCDDLIPVGTDAQCQEYPIQIALCSNCLTAHQNVQVEKHTLFPVSYHYRARFTGDVLRGFDGLLDNIEATFGSVSGKSILDIGCNDGSLLLKARDRGARPFGIEPTSAALDAQQAGLPVINSYFDAASSAEVLSKISTPDFIVLTNVFAHIENLPAVLDALRPLLGEKTKLVIENHYLGSVIAGQQFDTFYHEHPRTYSATSFSFIAKSLNLDLENIVFPSRYGGNIRVTMGRGSSSIADLSEVFAREMSFTQTLPAMAGVVERFSNDRQAILDAARSSDGKVYAKAFPGRSAILVKLLDLTQADVFACYEKPGSMKLGNYIPGTRIPIVSDAELPASADKLLNLAWHIGAEIREYYSGRNIEIVDIFDPKRYT
jgi:SAM-dependent methyltransferase